MRYLALGEVLELHRRILETSGGASGLRDLGALESSVAQPRLSAGGEDAYSTLAEKAAALSHALVLNHAFVDGNKRVGHAAMEVFLILNGCEIQADAEEQEQLFLSIASGDVSRQELRSWLDEHLTPTE